MSDVVGNLINEVFDLGYAEQDMELSIVLRNRKVRDTELPKIIRKHAKGLKYSQYAKIRNDVVHRGWLVDPEFDELYVDWVATVFMRAGDRDLETVLREASKEFDIQIRMRELVSSKLQTLSRHLAETRALLEELGTVLAEHVRKRS